jgi:hypothetical protein
MDNDVYKKLMRVDADSITKLNEILSLDLDGLEINNLPKLKEGIYFLYKNESLVYIGISQDIVGRIKNHMCSDKVFDNYKYLELKKNEAKIYERVLLNKYKPEYNNDLLTQKLRKEDQI